MKSFACFEVLLLFIFKINHVLFLVCRANLMFQFHIVYIVTDIYNRILYKWKITTSFECTYVSIEFGRVYSHTSRRFCVYQWNE